ncbi:hypothetical protein TcCL_Unassigned01191 [Trypanosoma cruzi]|nr:hypothetical protein TcCL_Unassigned01191 [Trypanosoma cruzi]
MSSQGEGKEGVRRRPCAPTAACGATGCNFHCEECNGRHACSRASSATFCLQSLQVLRGGAGDLSSLGLLRPFFLSAQREKQLFLHVTCWSASMLPTGCHAAVPLQCNSLFPHSTRGPPSLALFAGPWPAVPHWEAAHFFS